MANQERPYTFIETNSSVSGPYFNETEVGKGIVIGRAVGVRFLEEQRNIILIQLTLLDDGVPSDRSFEEQIKAIRRYRYEDVRDVNFRLRATHEQRSDFLRFQFESRLPVVTARRLGLSL